MKISIKNKLFLLFILVFAIYNTVRIHNNMQIKKVVDTVWEAEEADSITVQFIQPEREVTLTGEECESLKNNLFPTILISDSKKLVRKCDPKEYATIDFYNGEEHLAEASIIWLSNEEQTWDSFSGDFYIINGKLCIIKMQGVHLFKGKRYHINFDL